MSYLYSTTETRELQDILQNKIDKFLEHKHLKETKVDPILLPTLFDSRKDAVEHCADEIALNDNGQVVFANYCKHRLCPICVWREAAKKWHKTYEIIEHMEQKQTYVFAHLSLTIRNCTSEDLANTITELMKAINRLNSNKAFKKRVHGYIRSLEITYNPKQKEKLFYHPHYHFILALDPDYNEQSQSYLTTYDWRMMWQKAARTNYTTQVDIRIIKGNDLAGAVAEVSKYAVKASEIFKTVKTPEEIMPLEAAIYRRRLYSLGGVIKDAAKEIKAKNPKPEREELVKQSLNAHWYKYKNGKYVIRE